MAFACARTLRPPALMATTTTTPARSRAPAPPSAAPVNEPVEAILFDMDGVLTLSEELSRE